ncbi:hypothetical protein [Thioalkalivibrio sp.]|uniref:hypothetical protein n=1 Tax=Thioalkalivibrio sp. TaxID=2093813 RepID=UPI0035661385
MVALVQHGTTPEFLARFQGGFTGILYWHQLDALWERLRARNDGSWYVYAVGEEPPEQPVAAAKLDRFITEVDQLLRSEHHHDYCGVVYVDAVESPDMVKIYDPNHLGSSCGSSGLRVLPGWVLSRVAPVDLDAAVPLPRARRRWWQAIFPG